MAAVITIALLSVIMEKEIIDPRLAVVLMEREICRRAVLMHMLMQGYEHFVSIHMLKQSMKARKFTYEEAEHFADVLERHTGIKVAPERFIRNEDEDANELLEHYTELERMRNSQLSDTMRPIHDGFNRYLYHNLHVDVTHATRLRIALEAFLTFAMGQIDWLEMRRNILDIDLRIMKAVPVDSVTVRHDFIRFENVYYEICLKCANRERKRRGEPPSENFQINIF